jgi:hypothetical protein
VFKRAEEKGLKLEFTEKFKDRLVDEGFNPTYGARPLRRAIMRLIEVRGAFGWAGRPRARARVRLSEPSPPAPRRQTDCPS